MSIHCNPGVPKEVPPGVMEPLLAADPDIVSLEQWWKASHDELKWEYQYINRASEEKRKVHREQFKRTQSSALKALETECHMIQDVHLNRETSAFVLNIVWYTKDTGMKETSAQLTWAGIDWILAFAKQYCALLATPLLVCSSIR